ncbi:hypothetical protein [Corynebacterium sp. AOP12-C2-36]|uniref:hypothetical protein n=1 Tax=Corynebacterium sp. AOP12-C2-36 TaxID=3457723 RepID=UPI004033E374
MSNANIIGAMVAAGYLSPTEVDAYVHGQLALSDVPLTQLLREVADRIDHLEDQLSTDQDPAAAATQRGRSILNGLIG